MLFFFYAVVNLRARNDIRNSVYTMRVFGQSGLAPISREAARCAPCDHSQWWAPRRTTNQNGLCEVVRVRPCDHSQWWAQVDSNHRPHAYQACALTS